MGSLNLDGVVPILLDDDLLDHVFVVITTKLRRKEPVLLSWSDECGQEHRVFITPITFLRAEFDSTDGSGGMLAGLSATAIALSKKFLPDAQEEPGLIKRLGARTVVAATVRAIQLLGRQFVLGRTIGEAMGEANAQRREQPNLRFSYDMLGEGARTEHDAERYLASYQNAIDTIAGSPSHPESRSSSD